LSINSTRAETGVPASAVILTFDDGPNAHNDTTAMLLDVLKKYEVKRCYYGHIHGAGAANAFRGEKNGIRFDMIAADFTNFTPVLVDS
jgi:predicted phosphohydrolase